MDKKMTSGEIAKKAGISGFSLDEIKANLEAGEAKYIRGCWIPIHPQKST